MRQSYDENLDRPRLTRQREFVLAVMQDGHWLTLHEIQSAIWRRYRRHCPEASISARLRDLRRPEYGGRSVPRRRRGNPKLGLWEYRVEVDG